MHRFALIFANVIFAHIALFSTSALSAEAGAKNSERLTPAIEPNPGWRTTVSVEPHAPWRPPPLTTPRLLTSPRAPVTGSLVPPPSLAAPSIAALPLPKSHALSGLASYYWQDQKTANGETFDKTSMTAAHKTLPMNSRVRVIDRESGRSVIVRINDRGPFKPGRVIDLSLAAAQALGIERKGLAQVDLEVLNN